MGFSRDDRPPTAEEDPLEDYSFSDILEDYIDMVSYFGTDDDLVIEYRRVLEEVHGCTLITTGDN